jgi:hypothetical protein
MPGIMILTHPDYSVCKKQLGLIIESKISLSIVKTFKQQVKPAVFIYTKDWSGDMHETQP